MEGLQWFQSGESQQKILRRREASRFSRDSHGQLLVSFSGTNPLRNASPSRQRTKSADARVQNGQCGYAIGHRSVTDRHHPGACSCGGCVRDAWDGDPWQLANYRTSCATCNFFDDGSSSSSQTYPITACSTSNRTSTGRNMVRRPDFKTVILTLVVSCFKVVSLERN